MIVFQNAPMPDAERSITFPSDRASQLRAEAGA